MELSNEVVHSQSKETERFRKEHPKPPSGMQQVGDAERHMQRIHAQLWVKHA